VVGRDTGETKCTGTMDMQMLSRHDLVWCFFQTNRGDPMEHKYIARPVLLWAPTVIIMVCIPQVSASIRPFPVMLHIRFWQCPFPSYLLRSTLLTLPVFDYITRTPPYSD